MAGTPSTRTAERAPGLSTRSHRQSGSAWSCTRVRRSSRTRSGSATRRKAPAGSPNPDSQQSSCLVRRERRGGPTHLVRWPTPRTKDIILRPRLRPSQQPRRPGAEARPAPPPAPPSRRRVAARERERGGPFVTRARAQLVARRGHAELLAHVRRRRQRWPSSSPHSKRREAVHRALPLPGHVGHRSAKAPNRLLSHIDGGRR